MAVLGALATMFQLCRNVDNRSCGELQKELSFVLADRRGSYASMADKSFVAGQSVRLTDKPLNILI
jgi:hypothetical protein